jgi:uncharacterized protein (DUF697 family)
MWRVYSGSMGSRGWARQLVSLLPLAGSSASLPDDLGRLRSVLVETRPLRLLLLGSASRRGLEVLEALGGGPAPSHSTSPASWSMLSTQRGVLHYRFADWEQATRRAVQAQLGEAPPDIGLLLVDRAVTDPMQQAIDLEQRLGLPVLVVRVGERGDEESSGVDLTVGLGDPLQAATLGTRLAQLAPPTTHLGLARLLADRSLQDQVARRLTRLAAGLAAAVTATPLPVADIVPLTGLQIGLVTAIAYATGRNVDRGAVRELMLAAGLNIGAAWGLREGARALLKVALPGTGGAISAGIAFAGTWTLGEAARKFFVHNEPVAQGRRLVGSVRRRLTERGR